MDATLQEQEPLLEEPEETSDWTVSSYGSEEDTPEPSDEDSGSENGDEVLRYRRRKSAALS